MLFTTRILLITTLIIFATNGFSQDNQERVEERIQKLETENQDLRDIIKGLQDRLDKIESKDEKKKKEAAPEEEAASDSKEKKPADEGRIDDPDVENNDEAWLPSLKGETFQLGGRLQLEYYNIENENVLQSAIPDNEGGSFKLDEFRVYLDADFKNKIRFHGSYDVENVDEGSGLVDAYLDFEELPFNSEIRAGLHSRFFRPGRYTESYPLPGTAFWRSRVIGLTVKNEFDPFYTYVAVSNGVEIDDRKIGEDDTAARMLGDDETQIDADGNKEISAGLGIEYDFDKFGSVDLLAFGVLGELSNDDITFLQTEVPGYGLSNSDTKEFFGGNLDYSVGEWDFFAQAITGTDGTMDRFGWFTELSYKFEFSGLRYLDALRPLVRYSSLDTDLTPRAFSRNGSLTWDRQQWLFAVIAEIVDNVSFRAEYALNDEDTGGPEAQNNELLFQLEARF